MSYASDALIDALQRKVKRLEADNAELRVLAGDRNSGASPRF